MTLDGDTIGIDPMTCSPSSPLPSTRQHTHKPLLQELQELQRQNLPGPEGGTTVGRPKTSSASRLAESARKCPLSIMRPSGKAGGCEAR